MQFVREFAKLGLTRSVGGVLGLALTRELTPVVTSIILAGELRPQCLLLPPSEHAVPRELTLRMALCAPSGTHCRYACTGRVGSAFAAELGTMAVTEQTDSLRMLGSDPVDYLVSPRVIACMIALPILNLMCFTMGESAPPMVVCCGGRASMLLQCCLQIPLTAAGSPLCWTAC